MELNFEDLIISKEQAHNFAMSIFNDIKEYFLDLENIKNEILKISTNVILTTEGLLITSEDIFNYNLCKYLD